MRGRIFALVLVVLSAATASLADDRTVQVRFPAGTTGTSLSDTVVGRDAVLYKVGAEAGQAMSVVLSASNTATYFNVYAPGKGLGDEAIVTGEFTDPINNWTGVLPASGEYTIAVYLYRAAARRGESSNFTIDIAVDGSGGASVEGDFADGLAGGPDFLQVAVSGGGTLNLRSQPSAGAGLVTRLANGQNVRNLGCRMSEGRRWCRVATLADPGFEGWAAGEFLIEGSSAATQLPANPPSVGGGDETVRFSAGASSATLVGELAPGESRRYSINARNGQFLSVTVAPDSTSISYQILNPDQSFLLDQVSSDVPYNGQLWQSGNHVVEVINRTNAVSYYSVTIGIK